MPRDFAYWWEHGGKQRYDRRRNDPVEWEKEKARVRAYVASRRHFLLGYKTTVGCLDCGTLDGRLDFDHRPGEVKVFNLAHPRCSWKKVLAELAKCDVRCASCHSRRHGVERGGLQGIGARKRG